MINCFAIKDNRLPWIDTARGIGIILVILGHLRFPYVTTWIYTFHMPLFFFLSGCVYKQRSPKEFIIKEIKSLFIPYWTLSIVIWIFYVVVNTLVGENSLYGSSWNMLWNLIKQQGYWTVWFLACLFIARIIFFLVNCISNNKTIICFALSLCICLVGFLYYRLGGHILPWDIDIACVAQLFICLGFLFRNSKKCQSIILELTGIKWVVLSGVLLAISVTCGYFCIKVSGQSLDMSIGMYGNELLTAVSAIAGILLTVSIANKIVWKPLIYLGQNTLIIFAWHSRIMIVLLDYIYSMMGIFQGEDILLRVVKCIISFVIILAVLIPINELIKSSRIHAVFGM